MKNCENCFYWYNRQREILYMEEMGFCSHIPSTDDGKQLIRVYIHNSFEKVSHDYLNECGELKSHVVELVTHKTYCCNHWEDLIQCQLQEIV